MNFFLYCIGEIYETIDIIAFDLKSLFLNHGIIHAAAKNKVGTVLTTIDTLDLEDLQSTTLWLHSET
jgi:hypothetical protein